MAWWWHYVFIQILPWMFWRVSSFAFGKCFFTTEKINGDEIKMSYSTTAKGRMLMDGCCTKKILCGVWAYFLYKSFHLYLCICVYAYSVYVTCGHVPRKPGVSVGFPRTGVKSCWESPMSFEFPEIYAKKKRKSRHGSILYLGISFIVLPLRSLFKLNHSIPLCSAETRC